MEAVPPAGAEQAEEQATAAQPAAPPQQQTAGHVKREAKREEPATAKPRAQVRRERLTQHLPELPNDILYLAEPTDDMLLHVSFANRFGKDAGSVMQAMMVRFVNDGGDTSTPEEIEAWRRSLGPLGLRVCELDAELTTADPWDDIEPEERDKREHAVFWRQFFLLSKSANTDNPDELFSSARISLRFGFGEARQVLDSVLDERQRLNMGEDDAKGLFCYLYDELKHFAAMSCKSRPRTRTAPKPAAPPGSAVCDSCVSLTRKVDKLRKKLEEAEYLVSVLSANLGDAVPTVVVEGRSAAVERGEQEEVAEQPPCPQPSAEEPSVRVITEIEEGN